MCGVLLVCETKTKAIGFNLGEMRSAELFTAVLSYVWLSQQRGQLSCCPMCG